jgi:S-DNA-T family DNA segregation ATPase FtsK/SpoIIIE
VVDSIRYVGNVVPPLRPELIEAALEALGIAQLSRGLKAQGLQLVTPIHRDGPGYRADIDLPSVPAGAVIEKRDQLAAGLRRPLSVVWPQADPDTHEARLILWVGDKAPSRAKPRPWVLAKAGKVDLFEAFPVGVDPQGRPVTLCLMFASMIIGAIPRMGKTFALRVILLAAALDVRAELHVYDLKGGADLRPLGPVAHRYRIGDEPEDIAYLAADVAELRREMQRRYKVLRSLPERVCPEGKVTPELAARKDLRLHPIVFGLDETHPAFEHPEYGKQIEEDLTDLAKRGPAAGMMALFATQRPDARSLPPGISGNAVLRYCLKVMKHDANDMVLGSGAYKAGIRATMFTRSDKGTGYLVGEGDDPQIVTFGYVDAPTAKAVVARARAARELAGTITGYAAEQDQVTEEDEAAPTLLDDLAHVMGADEVRVWSVVLLERLAEYRPDTYTGWDAADLGSAAAAYGIKTRQIGRREGGKVVNGKGIARADVTTAITERDQRRVSGGPDRRL